MNYPPPSAQPTAYRQSPAPQPPTVTPAPAPQPPIPTPQVTREIAPARSRRADRTRSARGRRRKRKSPWSLTGWEALVVVLLCGALIYAVLEIGKAGASMRRLQAERQAEFEKYEQTVRDHQVKYRDLIEKYAAEYDLNPAFVSAIIKQESSFDPNAVSKKGAMGLMQFMPSTLEWVAPNCGISKADTKAVYVPENAIKMGCYLLKYIIRQIGSDDPVLVACAYHAGWGTVPSWLQNYSTDGKTLKVSQIPKEDTRTYAGRVLNSYAIYLQHYY